MKNSGIIHLIINHAGIIYLLMLISLIFISLLLIFTFLHNKENNKYENIWLIILNFINIPIFILTFRLIYSISNPVRYITDVFITQSQIFKLPDLLSMCSLFLIFILSFLFSFPKFIKNSKGVK